MNHLRAHWHHHLSFWGLLAAVIVLATAGAAGTAAVYYRVTGGYHPGPMAPAITIAGAHPPASYSLGKYLQRIHNQGLTSTCVGQTLSTLEEITWRERHRHFNFAPGFVYNQVNGGQDNGTTYDAAFHILLTQGDDRFRSWPAPDTAWWLQPTAAQRAAAAPYRYASWNAITLTDRTTIEYELSHGRPLALAIPVHDTVYHHFYDASPISYDAGAFHFWHSITVIGYSPTGIQILNSWGPGWGHNGQATFTWNFVARTGGYLVIASARPYIPAQKPVHKPVKPTVRTHKPPKTKKPPTHKKTPHHSALSDPTKPQTGGHPTA